MRLVSWNIENLVPWLSDAAAFRAQLSALGDPDVVCLQEIRLRPGDGALILDDPKLRPRSDHAPIAIELAGANCAK
jgi:exonuclease III